MTHLPANLRGFIAELQTQVRLLSERAAHLAAELQATREQIELRDGIIRGLRDESMKRNAPERTESI
jgi:hypothetical protein